MSEHLNMGAFSFCDSCLMPSQYWAQWSYALCPWQRQFYLEALELGTVKLNATLINRDKLCGWLYTNLNKPIRGVKLKDATFAADQRVIKKCQGLLSGS